MSLTFDELRPGQQLLIKSTDNITLKVEVRKVSSRILDATVVELNGKTAHEETALMFGEVPNNVNMQQAAELGFMRFAVPRIEARLVCAMITQAGQTLFRVESVERV